MDLVPGLCRRTRDNQPTILDKICFIYIQIYKQVLESYLPPNPHFLGALRKFGISQVVPSSWSNEPYATLSSPKLLKNVTSPCSQCYWNENVVLLGPDLMLRLILQAPKYSSPPTNASNRLQSTPMERERERNQGRWETEREYTR